MRVLALEPYLGGSHEAFLDGWIEGSRHEWTVLGLPAHHWKWRMRHAAWTLSDRVRGSQEDGGEWDAVWCSDMLDLAQWKGLVTPELAGLPTVAYFHENQLTYPDPSRAERDLHFAFTNYATCLAADRIWFNSEFHRRDLISAFERLLGRMPDHVSRDALKQIEIKSEVQPPGIEDVAFEQNLAPYPIDRPLHVAWAARWEHDKDPVTFFAALEELLRRGADWRVTVLGESFKNEPQVFAEARQRLDDRVAHWGYCDDRREYLERLAQADVVVSAARHEFFGLAVLEAMAAGVVPVLPRRLSYPELVRGVNPADSEVVLYADAEASAGRVADHLQRCDEVRRFEPERWQRLRRDVRECAATYRWTRRIPLLDDGLDSLSTASPRYS